MIDNYRQFLTGLALMAGFIIILIGFFLPIFGGQNGLNYLDNLYNSISKGSAYYIDRVQKDAEAYKGKIIDVTLKMPQHRRIEELAKLFRASDASVSSTGTDIHVKGDLWGILKNCLADADAMYYNQGKKISEKYEYDEKHVLYNWWKALKEMEKGLQRQEKFKEADTVALVVNKAVESAYNYYGIEPQKIADRVGIVTASLAFYVIYTVWYGFAFMLMFQGWGMKLEH